MLSFIVAILSCLFHHSSGFLKAMCCARYVMCSIQFESGAYYYIYYLIICTFTCEMHKMRLSLICVFLDAKIVKGKRNQGIRQCHIFLFFIPFLYSNLLFERAVFHNQFYSIDIFSFIQVYAFHSFSAFVEMKHLVWQYNQTNTKCCVLQRNQRVFGMTFLRFIQFTKMDKVITIVSEMMTKTLNYSILQ